MQYLKTDKAPAAVGPYSQGVAGGDMVFVSGQIPVDMADGHLELEDVTKAVHHCLNNVEGILGEAGLSLANVVKTTVFLTDMDDFATVNAAYAEHFGANPPARSCVQVAALPRGVHVEIEAIAMK